MSLTKPAVVLAGACALAVAGCSSATVSPSSAAESGLGAEAPQSAPGATDPDTALTSKDRQNGPSVQSGQDADSSVVVIVQLEESADSEATLASINEAVAGIFPGAAVTVEREYRNALRGYALRAPAGSIDVIRSVSGVQAVYLDGNNRLH